MRQSDAANIKFFTQFLRNYGQLRYRPRKTVTRVQAGRKKLQIGTSSHSLPFKNRKRNLASGRVKCFFRPIEGRRWKRKRAKEIIGDERMPPRNLSAAVKGRLANRIRIWDNSYENWSASFPHIPFARQLSARARACKKSRCARENGLMAHSRITLVAYIARIDAINARIKIAPREWRSTLAANCYLSSFTWPRGILMRNLIWIIEKKNESALHPRLALKSPVIETFDLWTL